MSSKEEEQQQPQDLADVRLVKMSVVVSKQYWDSISGMQKKINISWVARDECIMSEEGVPPEQA